MENTTIFKAELNDFIDNCLQAYMNDDYVKLSNILHTYQKKKRAIVKMLDELDNDAVIKGKNIILQSQFIAAYNIINKLVNIHTNIYDKDLKNNL